MTDALTLEHAVRMMREGAAIDPRIVGEIARLYRETMRDQSYQLTPLGQPVMEYLRFKRKRLTPESYRAYERILADFANYFPDANAITDFEPPVGTHRVEEFLDHRWGHTEPRTYNKSLSIHRDFFKYHVVRGNLHGDPMTGIESAKKRSVYRTTFNPDQIKAIIASQGDIRDRLACRLLLDFALRKGALQAVQIKHFDHYRRRLTIFTKGQKVREIPIPSKPFWFELERYIVEVEAKPDDFLMHRVKFIPNKGMHRYPRKAMSGAGLHKWWYRCLTDAGVVPEGTTSGERMHKARHTAGQRVLDATGNLKAAQMLLGHSSIQTTGDIYTDWTADQLAETMLKVLGEGDDVQ